MLIASVTQADFWSYEETFSREIRYEFLISEVLPCRPRGCVRKINLKSSPRKTSFFSSSFADKITETRHRTRSWSRHVPQGSPWLTLIKWLLYVISLLSTVGILRTHVYFYFKSRFNGKNKKNCNVNIPRRWLSRVASLAYYARRSECLSMMFGWKWNQRLVNFWWFN